MSLQTYDTHTKWEPGWHFFTFPVAALTFIGSIYHLVQAWGTDTQYVASLMVAATLALCGATFYARFFSLKAQDRVIRLEERLRAKELTGADLDPRLTMRQIIGLRFASDAEWPALAKRAADEGMSEKEIKQAVQDWRPDTYRV